MIRQGKFLNVDWTEHPGYYGSSEIRQNIMDNNNSQEAYYKSYVKEKSFPETIDSFSVSGIKELDGRVTLNFKMRITPSVKIIFISTR